MRAIAQLREEHARIERMRTYLEEALEPFRAIAVARSLAFFARYVDTYHHTKEEEVLFPELLARARDVVHGPMQVMEKEHVLFSAYLTGARRILPDAVKGDAKALERLRRCVRSMLALQEAHATKEEASLYSISENLLPPSMDEVLIRRFFEATQDSLDSDDVELFERFAESPTEGTIVARAHGLEGKPLDPATLDREARESYEARDTAPSVRIGRTLYESEGHRCLLLHDFGRGLAVQSNQFMIVSENEGMLLDPGGPKVYPAVFAEAMMALDDGELKYIFLSHQDPDVATSLNAWLMDTTATAYVSRLWMRFLPHFGIDSLLADRLEPIPDAGMTVQLGKHKLLLLPAHFLHSAGNFQVYDPVSRILFSGDLGSSVGVAYTEVRSFDVHEPKIRHFHQRYMASGAAMKDWARMARSLEIEMIAPQHGAMIVGAVQVAKFIDWCETLECGVDQLAGRFDVPAEFKREGS